MLAFRVRFVCCFCDPRYPLRLHCGFYTHQTGNLALRLGLTDSAFLRIVWRLTSYPGPADGVYFGGSFVGPPVVRVANSANVLAGGATGMQVAVPQIDARGQPLDCMVRSLSRGALIGHL